MKPILSSEQRRRIASGIRDRYARVAAGPEGHFAYPTGRKGLEMLQYDQTLMANLSEEAAASYCGVGNPFALGKIHPGERVLDVGCGGGVDTILAGFLVGPKGTAVGVDLVPEMVARAERNLETTGARNVAFQNASGEALPFADRSFDIVLSNGAINLMPDKQAVLSEIERVLKPGGRLMMADQIAVARIAGDWESRLANWFQ